MCVLGSINITITRYIVISMKFKITLSFLTVFITSLIITFQTFLTKAKNISINEADYCNSLLI